jgi:energy-coupling factor transporter transmembrane protein EcfT
MRNSSSRPWFGPKRVGYGLRPQTWQGWAVVAIACLAVIVIVLITRS